MNSLKGFKTIAFNLIMTLTMVYQMWQPDVELPDAEQVTGAIDSAEAAITAIWAIGNMWLRAITDSPIFKKE